MHKLLERQLKRHFGSIEAIPPELRPLVESISTTYEEADTDRRLVEHSLELASQELMQRNQELRAKQHEQQVIFDSVPALIIYKDTQNRIVRLNETAAHALGGSAAAMEGKATAEVLPPAVAQQLYEDDLAVIHSGEPKHGIIESHATADGSVRWMRTDKVPYKDESGHVIGVIVFSVDITERKAAEAALRESEERYRLIVETATEGIWTLDLHGNTTFANSVMAEMLGHTRSEMAGRNVFEFIPPEDIELGKEKLGVLMAGTHVALDFRFRRKNGSDLWTQASGAPMLDADGKVIGTLGMLTDITKRKAAEAQLAAAFDRLQQVDRERMQFLNNAAHELATPLTPIKLQMRVLSLDGALTQSHRKAADILERNFERLSHLVKDLLDAARLQATSLKLHAQPTDLRDVVYQSIETYLPAASDAGVNLDVDGEPPEVLASVDPGRVGQVLDNLLSNAIKFTPRGGRVVVSLDRDSSNRPVVRVTDTGAGMRPQDLDRLFRPFSQVHDTMQKTVGGTGLGLYVSRGIIEAHGGAIHAESAGLGKGSTFWFHLPAPDAPAPLLTVQQTAAAQAS